MHTEELDLGDFDARIQSMSREVSTDGTCNDLDGERPEQPACTKASESRSDHSKSSGQPEVRERSSIALGGIVTRWLLPTVDETLKMVSAAMTVALIAYSTANNPQNQKVEPPAARGSDSPIEEAIPSSSRVAALAPPSFLRENQPSSGIFDPTPIGRRNTVSLAQHSVTSPDGLGMLPEQVFATSPNDSGRSPAQVSTICLNSSRVSQAATPVRALSLGEVSASCPDLLRLSQIESLLDEPLHLDRPMVSIVPLGSLPDGFPSQSLLLPLPPRSDPTARQMLGEAGASPKDTPDLVRRKVTTAGDHKRAKHIQELIDNEIRRRKGR